jgi:hypothetical protein
MDVGHGTWDMGQGTTDKGQGTRGKGQVTGERLQGTIKNDTGKQTVDTDMDIDRETV